jgi:hypothetical protein
MERIDLEQLFEIGLSLFRLTTDEIVVPDVVEKGGRRGSCRKGGPIVLFCLLAFPFLIQPCRVAQRLGMEIRQKGERPA